MTAMFFFLRLCSSPRSLVSTIHRFSEAFMAALDAGARRHPSSILSCFALLLFIAALFLFSAVRRSFSPEGSFGGALTSAARRNVAGGSICNYNSGKWIRDQSSVITRYDSSCKEIFKGWNCISNGKSNAPDLLQWRWKPSSCDLLPLDPVYVLRRFRNKSIGFVGDSLNRNMFVSLFCMLRRVYVGDVRKWRPAGADRGFTFVRNNLTLAYHRTNLLARYGSSNGGVLESLGFKQGYQVDVDVPEHTWAEAPLFHDIIIFNTGHWWWAPSKFDPIRSPMLFFEKGTPMLPPLPPDVGIDITLKYMISYIEKNMKSDGVKFFLSQSPRHFEEGDWNQGGSCRRVQPLASEEVEDFFSLERNGTNMEVRLVNQHLLKALKGSSFHILDITHMSEFRSDAHPSTAGGKKHEDCMHWCLPGLTDSWVDLLMVHLENLKY